MINTKDYDDELLRKIEQIRLIKDNQCRDNEHFELKRNEERAYFIRFFEEVCQKKQNRPQYVTSLVHFKTFLGRDNITFSKLTSSLFKDFKEYLLTHREVTKKISKQNQ